MTPEEQMAKNLEIWKSISREAERAGRMHNMLFHSGGDELGHCALWGSMCNGNWFERTYQRLKRKLYKPESP